jgi:glycosyltransferase involved in cell wall biosynthesis
MKILLSAYSCAPWKTSEPGNAWRLINEMWPEHEIWAVIDPNDYAESMERHLKEHPMPGFHPIFQRMPRPMEKWLHGRGPLEAIYYARWQEKLIGTARQLHQQIHFDLAHHITYGRCWSPCGVRQLGLPFIWGPVGAAETPPASFVTELPIRDRLFEWLRDTGRKRALRTQALRETAHAATVAIGVTRESCDALRELGARRVEQLPQMALPEADLAQFESFPSPPPGPLRALCMGRLLHWKGFHLAIRAFAAFAKGHPEAQLLIVNDGPFRSFMEQTASALGASGQVRFLGRLPTYQKVMETIAQSHVLMHPALHEGFGNVCLEALAAGRPVVCLDIGGPASQITPETGFAAPATTPDKAVSAMAAFLERINRDRPFLAQLSANARQRVRQHFTMRQYGRAMRSFYADAINFCREKPTVTARVHAIT